MNEADIEFDRARRKSQGRFRSAFESIFEKYGHIDEDDDIIDLRSGRLIVDNGRLRAAGVIELGDLLRHTGSSSPLARVDNRYSTSPELGVQIDQDGRSVSPELIADVNLSTHRDPSLLKRYRTKSSDSDSLDLGFGTYDDIRSHEQRAKQRVVRRRHDSERSAVGYESSDSLATDLDTPIDVYFTSSIEQYLDKLRQQIAAPTVLGTIKSDLMESVDEDETYGVGSGSQQSYSAESGYILKDLNGGLRRYTLYSYTIPSSPRTMTSLDDSWSDGNSGDWQNSSPALGSEVSESAKSEFSTQLLEGYDMSSPDHPAYEHMQAAYGTESLEYPERQSRHGSTAGFYGDIADDDADDADDADASGEEHVELPNAYSRHTLWEPSYLDFSPNLGSAATVMRMGAMPSPNTPASLPLRPQAEARSMRSSKELYDNDPMHGLSVRSHWNWHELPAANVHAHAHANDDTFTSSSHFPAGKPIVFRPQPVAPHVFFKRDGMALNGGENNSSSRSSISGVAYANAYERGGGMAGHVVRDEYEDDGDSDSDCSGELPRFEATTAFNHYMTE